MNKRDLWIVRILALLFLIALGFGIMKYLISLKEKPVPNIKPDLQRFVEAEVINYSSIVTSVKATGRIVSLSNVDLISEASGKIITGDISLKKGSQFKKGDVIFSIYPDEAILALKASKSAFLNQLANLLPEMSVDFQENESTFKDFFLAIDLNKDLPPLPEINDEKFKVFLASRNILSNYYNIKKEELALKRHSVKATFNGSIKEIYLETGAFANPGSKVANVICIDELEMEIPLEVIEAQWIKIGKKVKVYLKNSDKYIWGTVVRKSKFVDENTQSQVVFVKLNYTSDNILVGEYLTAEFEGYNIDNTMEIPRNAVYNFNEVYIIKNGKLQKQIINILKTNESTLYFNGIAPYDTIVLQPLIGVQEGIPAVMIGSEKANKILEQRNEKKEKS